ncbi:MAG TPA: efflux transporter outer membrane subunit [Novosphingobium sp.]|nr:efflux transporter outer membrane subunit [Novosphingobium sp.]
MAERRLPRWLATGVLATSMLAGCNMAPAYRPPQLAMPAHFRESAGPWAPASPGRARIGAQWWQALGSAELDGLEARLLASSPDLAAALARHDIARAALTEARASALPQVDAGADITNNRQSANRPLRGSGQPDEYAADTVGAGASYELDLWGRVRNTVAAAHANADASADDLAAARLSLTATLAQTYIALVGTDRDCAILADAVAVYGRAADVTRHRFEEGIASGIDLGRADAQLASAQAALAEAQGQRARLEHAIATMVGTPASSFAIAPQAARLAVLPVPAALPSALLQDRPDVAAAERRMYAANRGIGVARAALYPQIDLIGGGGVQDTALAGLMAAPNLFWSVGPQISLPLFDGGKRRARVRQAQGEWRAASALYRGAVLGAIGEVEDGLAMSRQLTEASAAQERAAAASGSAASLAYGLYVKGAASLLDVVTAQTTALTAARLANQTYTRRLQTGVDLVRALGGGVMAPATKA